MAVRPCEPVLSVSRLWPEGEVRGAGVCHWEVVTLVPVSDPGADRPWGGGRTLKTAPPAAGPSPGCSKFSRELPWY